MQGIELLVLGIRELSAEAVVKFSNLEFAAFQFLRGSRIGYYMFPSSKYRTVAMPTNLERALLTSFCAAKRDVVREQSR